MNEYTIIKILFCLLTGTGIFCILADSFRVPFFRTSKAAHNLSRQKKQKATRIDIWLESFAEYLSRHIKLNEYKRERLKTDLTSAGISLSPEMHTANSLVKAGIVALLAIPMYFIFPLASPLILVCAIITYTNSFSGVAAKIREKREKIEYELPCFVARIQSLLRHNRDVIRILESYRESAGTEFKEELSVTIADMRSGNQVEALNRLSSRVGSSLLSDVTRGLCSVLDGNDSQAYWDGVARKCSEEQRQRLIREAQKIPKKISILSFFLLLCIMLIYLVVLGVQIIDSLEILFI